ncbi:DNA excision repair protein ERCC-6-like 2 [Mytilus californianus]|uniref:DNA excision repair protein ERCC-6-like 2 n=1 Tax=Mytilus californianus TaxID=6549 RepID=UPI00224580B4|nr:DNA excision repair protein ERCC-6-like 2 [Mytilus californianus]
MELKEKVWNKGEECSALYQGDGNFYPGFILKIIRSPGLKAIVQFDGYSKEEAETVDITQIKPIQRKQKEKSDLILVSEEKGDGLFKPLCGKEEDKYLESKYRDLSDDESDVSSSASILKTPWRKGVVATGGQSINHKNTSVRGRRSKVKSVNSERKNTDKSQIDKKQRNITENDSVHLELSKDTFDSQKPSTSRTALRHTRKPIYLSDSSDDSFNDRKTSRPDSSKLNEDHKNKSDTKPSLKKCRNTSTDSTEENSDFKNEGFDDYDLEKPKFKFTPSAAKVPYKLSGPDEMPVIQIPATINRYLRDYQRMGIQFMYNHYKNGQGCILGDDMGLGKTVQVIGFTSALMRKHGNRIDMLKHKPKFIRQMSDNKKNLEDDETAPMDPFLIIGPGSVLYNWMDELETWGYFTVGKFHGTDKEQCFADTKKGKHEIVITTYETYRDNQELLNSINWSAVIVDEVHKIKGQQAQITQALKAINTDLRFGLTGTALQNDMLELWCILDWAQPNCLGDPEEFKYNYVEPIKQGQKIDATKRQLAEARKLKEKFSAIRNKMLLRRTKMLISDQLPTKDDNVVYCRLTPFQEAVYKCLLQHPLMNTVMKMDKPCDCGSGHITGTCCNKLKEFKVSFREVMFTFLSLFLKVGNHVALMIPARTSEDNLKPLTKHILQQVYEQFPQYFTDSKEASFRTLSDPKYCGKMKVLKGLLSVFYKDHSKVLVFSYSTRVLDIFEQYLMTTEYEYRRLDGSTSMKKRMALVREFNRDPNIFIFLICTRAGGLGLNLTGANRVVIFDPNWNPTHDLQAQDRAYRIGQRRNVKVYRLISAGTIEENMYLRQIYKQQLDSVAIQNENANRYFKGIAGDRAHQGELFGVKNMFQFRTGDKCLTLDILNENERVETELVGFTVSKYISNDDEQREDNSEESEEDPDTTNEEIEDQMDNSLLKLFGITDRDDFDINSIEDSDDEHYIGDVDSQDSHRSAQSNTATRKKETPNNTGSKRTSNRKTSTPAKSSSSLSKQGKTSAPERSKLKKSSSSFSSVSDVFDQCGVVHVHENRQLVGGSKAEDHMTKCAIQDVYELHQNSQIPAGYCEPMSESDDSGITEPTPVKSRGRKSSKPDHNTPTSVVIGTSRVLIGQTPKTIRLKQFEEITQFFDSVSAVELSERILLGSTQSRLKLLKDFYTKDKPDFSQIFSTVKHDGDQNDTSLGSGLTSTKKTTNPDIKRKRRVRRKENETLGISFLDFPDSESQKLESKSRIESDGSQTESLDIGIPSTSFARRKPSPSKKPTKGRSKNSVQKNKHKDIKDTCSVFTVDEFTEEKTVVITSDNHSDDIEELLHKIGHQADAKISVKEENQKERGDNLSILDDIFSSPEKSTQKRKKPPKKNKKSGKVENIDFDSLTETSITEDEDYHFADVSTLKDDGIDVFTDPVKWKSLKRHQKERVSLVDQMVSDAAEDYDELFKSGKMKRVKKSNKQHRPENKSDSDTNDDPSASLF